MESKLRVTKSSLSFPGSKDWWRLELMPKELFQAIQENNVDGLVRECLREKYGESPLFATLVANVTGEVLKAIVAKIKETKPHSGIACLIDNERIESAHKSMEARKTTDALHSYWAGDPVPM